MNVIICIDKRGGMIFNKRRVSRDKLVCEDILKTVRGEKLYIKPYSKILFDPLADRYELPEISDDPMSIAKDGEWCFIEDEDVSAYADRIERLLVYNWNESYPYDLRFDMSILDQLFRISGRTKFPGHSHDMVVRELYRKDFRDKAK